MGDKNLDKNNELISKTDENKEDVATTDISLIKTLVPLSVITTIYLGLLMGKIEITSKQVNDYIKNNADAELVEELMKNKKMINKLKRKVDSLKERDYEIREEIEDSVMPEEGIWKYIP